VREALDHVGFEMFGDGRLVRYSLPGMISRDAAETALRARLPELQPVACHTPEELEARFWPLKVIGAGIPSYVIPIKRHWAEALFDRHLAAQKLFRVPEGPALALENVYFSASNVTIPVGSRILWYVSDPVQEVRAVSACLGTDIDAATRLSARYHRLGVYRWQDVLSAAKGEPKQKLRAYRFARTELLKQPVGLREVKELIQRHMGTRNPLASPLQVPEGLFEELYHKGTGVGR